MGPAGQEGATKAGARLPPVALIQTYSCSSFYVFQPKHLSWSSSGLTRLCTAPILSLSSCYAFQCKHLSWHSPCLMSSSIATGNDKGHIIISGPATEGGTTEAGERLLAAAPIQASSWSSFYVFQSKHLYPLMELGLQHNNNEKQNQSPPVNLNTSPGSASSI